MSPLLAVLRYLPACLWAALIFWVSSLTDPPDAGLLDLPFSDKLGHAAIYGILALLIAWGGEFRWPALGAVLAMFYGATDEWHQAWVPGRSATVADWLADSAGAWLALWLWYELRVRQRWRRG